MLVFAGACLPQDELSWAPISIAVPHHRHSSAVRSARSARSADGRDS